MTIKELTDFTKEKMDKTISSLDREYKSIRAGRANASILDKIMVDYYGSPTPIQQMAAVSTPDARTLMIQPWDGSTLKTIERAILTSDIGINPNNDGKVIRLNFPPLTEERRKDITKDVSKKGEEAKVALRNIRRDAIDKLKIMKKDGDITEDDQKDAEKSIQNIIDKYTKEIDSLTSDKQKEIMSI